MTKKKSCYPEVHVTIDETTHSSGSGEHQSQMHAVTDNDQ